MGILTLRAFGAKVVQRTRKSLDKELPESQDRNGCVIMNAGNMILDESTWMKGIQLIGSASANRFTSELEVSLE